MSNQEAPRPDLSQLPPPLTPEAAADFSEFPPPSLNPPGSKAPRRPRRLGLIITASVAAVVLVVLLVVMLITVFMLPSTGQVTSYPSAPAPTVSADTRTPEAMPVTPTPGESAPQTAPDSSPKLDVPGSGAAPIPEEATRLCVYGTTKEVEVYLFENSNSGSGEWIYVGGNADLGYLTLPAKTVYFPGGGVSGHRMTNTDGTEYYLTGHELTVTPANGEGFYQIVRSWEQYGC